MPSIVLSAITTKSCRPIRSWQRKRLTRLNSSVNIDSAASAVLRCWSSRLRGRTLIRSSALTSIAMRQFQRRKSNQSWKCIMSVAIYLKSTNVSRKRKRTTRTLWLGGVPSLAVTQLFEQRTPMPLNLLAQRALQKSATSVKNLGMAKMSLVMKRSSSKWKAGLKRPELTSKPAHCVRARLRRTKVATIWLVPSVNTNSAGAAERVLLRPIDTSSPAEGVELKWWTNQLDLAIEVTAAAHYLKSWNTLALEYLL